MPMLCGSLTDPLRNVTVVPTLTLSADGYPEPRWEPGSSPRQSFHHARQRIGINVCTNQYPLAAGQHDLHPSSRCRRNSRQRRGWFAGDRRRHQRHRTRARTRIAAPNARRQVNNMLAFTSCRRATTDTEAPGCNVSATIRRFSSSDHNRRRRPLRPRARPSPAELTISDNVHQWLCGHDPRVNTSNHCPLPNPNSSRRHSPGSPWSTVERLDLAFLVHRHPRRAPADRGRGRRCRSAWWRTRIARTLEAAHTMRLSLCAASDALHRTELGNARSFSHRPTRPVRRLMRRFGAGQRHVRAPPLQRSGLPGLRRLSRSRPSIPASAKRCCQRQIMGMADAEAEPPHAAADRLPATPAPPARARHASAAGCDPMRSLPGGLYPMRSRSRKLSVPCEQISHVMSWREIRLNGSYMSTSGSILTLGTRV